MHDTSGIISMSGFIPAMSNDATGIIAVSGFFCVMSIIALGVAISFVIRSIRGVGSSRSRKFDAEETQLIQEIHHGLSRMESRVESLETLLMDTERQKKARFDNELRKD